MKILSWNVNGLRAILKKDFKKWFLSESPDVLCIQETKISEDQLTDELKSFAGYRAYFSFAEKKGYSGVAILSKNEPKEVKYGIGKKEFDSEGRILIADYGQFVLCNIYFPNGKASADRLKYKMDFYDAILKYVDGLHKRNRKVIICGDVNTAHTEIDLSRPKENEKISGFLPDERKWIDKLISHGFVDTFRVFTKEGKHYSWWDYKTGARARNVGWRIDYFFASKSFGRKLKSAFILSDVMGSDHCPVGIELK